MTQGRALREEGGEEAPPAHAHASPGRREEARFRGQGMAGRRGRKEGQGRNA